MPDGVWSEWGFAQWGFALYTVQSHKKIFKIKPVEVTVLKSEKSANPNNSQRILQIQIIYCQHVLVWIGVLVHFRFNYIIRPCHLVLFYW